MFAEQTETDLPSCRPNVLTTSDKLDCFARPADGGNGARNDEKRPYLSALVPSKRAAFTKPSRGTSGSERRTIINGNRVFRFDCERCRLTRGAAFTLAEVLITLGVIGVVAAITLPTLLTNVNERINSNRQANIAYKITQATDKMKAMGLLGTYASTDDFVDELQKHLKVAKRCSASNIADCWPTEKVTTANGEEFEVKNAKTGKNLNYKNNKSDNVGLVLADGASIILTYNQDSSGMDVGDVITASNKSLPVGFGKSQDFAYTTNTTAAIDFVMDVNGKKGPNSETRDSKYHDIRSFKAASFSTGCDVKIPGIGCVVNLGTSYEAINTCDGSKYLKYDSNGSSNTYCATNYWAGAKKACDDIGMTFPDIGALESIYNKKNDYFDLFHNIWFWTSSESSSHGASVFSFVDGRTLNYDKYDHVGALCVGN